MDTTARQWAKALSWQSLGLISTAGLAFLFTGSLRDAGGLALSSAGLALFTYVLHEKAWELVSWGRRHRRPSGNNAGEAAPNITV